MKYVREMAAVPAEEVAHFVHIASVLIVIKSKSLLPMLEYTEEEGADVAELEDRMKLFNLIRRQVVPTLNSWKKQSVIAATPNVAKQVVFLPDNSCTIKGLRKNADAVLQGLSFLREPPQKKVGTKVRIEEVIERVLAAVTKRVSVSLQLLSAKADRQEKIMSFLAVLELMRKNLLTATQDEHFNDIVIAKQNHAT